MTDPHIQKQTCDGICKKFLVKKPVGEGRYGSGQGHCQICNTWIDHKGAHMKDGSTATKDSLGWFCNCCNYRVRQNPRNKVYKEKLRESKIENEDSYDIDNDDLDDSVTAENLFISRGQANLLKKITTFMPNVDEVKSVLEINEKMPKQLQYEINDNWETIEKFLSFATNYQKLNKISAIILFEKLKDEIKKVPSKDEFLNKVNLDGGWIDKEFMSWGHFLDLLQYDPWYRTTKKSMKSEINENKKNEEINQISKKTENFEERFIESQRRMDEILLDKNELQGIFLKLKEKLKQIDLYTIREFSRKI